MSANDEPEWTAEVHFYAATVPPPLHDEYRITLAAVGDFRLDYSPDYNKPVWTYTAPVDSETRAAVRSVVERVQAAPPVDRSGPQAIGGDRYSASTRMSGRWAEAPLEPARELWRLLGDPFGQDVWDEIRERRQRYMDEHPHGPR
ncbi:hypothetical protein ACFPIJ_47925 [Dactylosporangium cerinum]|uniref:DUF317 domain-containing protein n=1 Tax=Dactylosporangium cerinum TaxID=1434730 RepID=A0ABV9WCN9_9ACTN